MLPGLFVCMSLTGCEAGSDEPTRMKVAEEPEWVQTLDAVNNVGMAVNATHSPLGLVKFVWLAVTDGNPARAERRMFQEWIEQRVESDPPPAYADRGE
ncbi:MAG: hypothetical protein HC927_03555 [Deltaproteobacteria bacterium]|nr:hypothetical protein [Deltaproteobacteria bacterium]